jgi:D-arabinose 1-dehydrogenase-like Zn-dependent alcohol dehydrogenase
MRSIVVVENGVVKVVNIPKNKITNPYQSLVHTEMAVICNSTDAKLISEHFPGITDYPLLLGHETVGKVVKK